MQTLNIFFGIASLLGFIATSVQVYFTLDKIEPIKNEIEFYDQFRQVFLTLSGGILALIVCFIVLVFYHSRTTKKLTKDLGTLPLDKERLEQEKKLETQANVIASKYTHNILHDHRYVLWQFDEIITNMQASEEDVSAGEIEKTLESFHRFMIKLLDNLVAYFNFITQDDCAACIKVLNEKKKVKTFFRDSLNYRFRSRSDLKQDDSPFIYSVSDNTAFYVISNDGFKDTTFFCDDLVKMKEDGKYNNANPQWETLYRACAVVPIRRKLKENRSNMSKLLGFICVDNLKGGFEREEFRDFLSSFGDLVYNLFEKYDQIAAAAVKKGVENERLQVYKSWDDR